MKKFPLLSLEVSAISRDAQLWERRGNEASSCDEVINQIQEDDLASAAAQRGETQEL